jgi:hypothetical protein
MPSHGGNNNNKSPASIKVIISCAKNRRKKNCVSVCDCDFYLPTFEMKKSIFMHKKDSLNSCSHCTIEKQQRSAVP